MWRRRDALCLPGSGGTYRLGGVLGAAPGERGGKFLPGADRRVEPATPNTTQQPQASKKEGNAFIKANKIDAT